MSGYPLDVSKTESSDGLPKARRRATGVSVALFVASVAGTVAGIVNSPAGQALQVVSKGPVSKSIPFDLIDNRIFVKIYLDGKGPFNFIFDTGADAVITPQVASALGLSVAADVATSGVGTQSVATGKATVGETRLGPYRVRNHDFAVLTIDGTREVFGTVPVDGVIGLPYFERYAVKIDYAHKTLNLAPASTFKYQGRGSSIPFIRLDEIPTVAATLDGISGEFDVDTGARSSLILFSQFIERFKLRAKYAAQVEGITGWGIGGPVRSQLARAKQFSIGNTIVAAPIIRLTTQKAGLTTTLKKAGLIGPGILRQFDVTFDYAHKRMILERNSLYGIRDTYDKTGLWLGQDGRHFKVLDVVNRSPASDRGFKIGDEVLSIDGVPSDQLSLTTVRTSFQTKPNGTVVRMTIRNANGISQRALILRDLV